MGKCVVVQRRWCHITYILHSQIRSPSHNVIAYIFQTRTILRVTISFFHTCTYAYGVYISIKHRILHHISKNKCRRNLWTYVDMLSPSKHPNRTTRDELYMEWTLMIWDRNSSDSLMYFWWRKWSWDFLCAMYPKLSLFYILLCSLLYRKWEPHKWTKSVTCK